MSRKSEILKTVEDLLLPILKDNHFEFVDIEFEKEGTNWYLRVFIDKENGITIDDCEIVSRSLENKLDEIDPISHPYILEVSSPGIDRPLKKDQDYIKNIGKVIEIKLYQSINGEKELMGELSNYEDDHLILKRESGEKIKVYKKDIAIARLAILF